MTPGDLMAWVLTGCGVVLALSLTGALVHGMWFRSDTPEDVSESEEEDHDDN